MSHVDTDRCAEPRSFPADPGRDAASLAPDKTRAFWRNIEHLSPGATLQPGDHPREILILSGWACEQRILDDGRRQIFAFLLPGDPVQIQARSSRGSRSVLALTQLEFASVESLLAVDEPGAERLGRTLKDARRERCERLFDYIVRIGRLTAKERLVHLLLELHERLDAVNLVKDGAFRLPLTQELLADALGLSLVHINRTLQQLRREGCVQLKGGLMTLPDIRRLTAMSSYERRPQRSTQDGAAGV